MDPTMSWALFGTGVVAIGGYYYYTETQKKIARARDGAGRRRGSQGRLDTKERRSRGKDSGSSDQVASDFADIPSTTANGGEGAKKRKGKKRQPTKLSQSSAADVGNQPELGVEDQEDEEIDNTEFARQFSNKQSGTDLKKPDDPAEKQRGKKYAEHTRATVEVSNSSTLTSNVPTDLQQPSAASSTTGADADDDLSPAHSPDLGATSSAVDVSDMLEAPAKGLAILNITASTKPQSVRQPKQQKPLQAPETKKQRQNRRKKEEQRAAREEDEKERRVLLETQLRTVREAEGRPAKNGLGMLNAPPSNAWSKTANINGGLKVLLSSTNQVDTSLLDTFDDSQSSANGATSLSALGANGGSSPQAASTSTFTSKTDLPSEEEQLRMINEMDSDNAWSTVNKGGKAKKSKTAAAIVNSQDSISSSKQARDKKENLPPASKFAALDVEHSTDEALDLEKRDEVVTWMQPAPEVTLAFFASDKDNDKDDGFGSGHLVDTTSTTEVNKGHPITISGDSISNSVEKSITGLEIPDFVLTRSHDMWIMKDTPAEMLPEGWYHYDNGCRYGNAKIPRSIREYESEVRKHTRRGPDGELYPHGHRLKAKLEKDAYDKCFLIYRSHVGRTIDLNKWNRDNIKQHSAYESDWPWALLPHPSEGWNAGFHPENRDCAVCEDFSR